MNNQINNKIQSMIDELKAYDDDKTVILNRPDKNIVQGYPWENQLDKNQNMDFVLWIGWFLISLGVFVAVLAVI